MTLESNLSESISIILCAYTEDRWVDLLKALDSVKKQNLHPAEIIVIIDHNMNLFRRIRDYDSTIKVLENSGPKGLSGARNTGLNAAKGSIIAFMDEDAAAAPDWLQKLVIAYKKPGVVGVGGRIQANWASGRPEWFPDEFLWVVGCSYLGLPTFEKPVRNLIGCNMSFRSEVFERVGGFQNGIGRIGSTPLGCEETELCIRISHNLPKSLLLYIPEAVVYHQVTPERAKWNYFRSRCYAEGVSKALISKTVGSQDALSNEKSYALFILSRGIIQRLRGFFIDRKTAGLLQAGAIFLGFLITTYGYLLGTFGLFLKNNPLAQGVRARLV